MLLRSQFVCNWSFLQRWPESGPANSCSAAQQRQTPASAPNTPAATTPSPVEAMPPASAGTASENAATAEQPQPKRRCGPGNAEVNVVPVTAFERGQDLAKRILAKATDTQKLLTQSSTMSWASEIVTTLDKFSRQAQESLNDWDCWALCGLLFACWTWLCPVGNLCNEVTKLQIAKVDEVMTNHNHNVLTCLVCEMSVGLGFWMFVHWTFHEDEPYMPLVRAIYCPGERDADSFRRR